MVRTARLSLRCSMGARRGLSGTAKVSAEGQQQEQGSSSSTATGPAPGSSTSRRASLTSLLTDSKPLPASASPSRRIPRSLAVPARRPPNSLQRSPYKSSIEPLEVARYRLHATCNKHNTILNLTRDMQLVDTSNVRETFNAVQQGIGFASMDPTEEQKERDAKMYGQSVARVTCGSVGFRKAQRSTFEAATRCANRMFEMIEQLG